MYDTGRINDFRQEPNPKPPVEFIVQMLVRKQLAGLLCLDFPKILSQHRWSSSHVM